MWLIHRAVWLIRMKSNVVDVVQSCVVDTDQVMWLIQIKGCVVDTDQGVCVQQLGGVCLIQIIKELHV